MPYSKKQGYTIIEFGSGDISVNLGKMDEKDYYDEIIFMPTEAGEIGRECYKYDGKTLENIKEKPILRMIFTKKESIDVVIEGLQELKKRYKK